MTYGYNNQYGSVGAHGQSLGYDAAASERLRIQQAQRDRERQGRERMRQELTKLERERDHAKLELSHHQTEARRLQTEIEHGARIVQDTERILVTLQQKEHHLRAALANFDQSNQKTQKEVIEKRKESDDATEKLHHFEDELQLVQKEIAKEKNIIFDIGNAIQKMGLSTRQSELEKHKKEIEANHAQAERMQKEKDVDNKKRALTFIEQKRAHEVNEMQRLEGELKKTEMMIQTLSSRVR
jgi:hypothetical protein